MTHIRTTHTNASGRTQTRIHRVTFRPFNTVETAQQNTIAIIIGQRFGQGFAGIVSIAPNGDVVQGPCFSNGFQAKVVCDNFRFTFFTPSK